MKRKRNKFKPGLALTGVRTTGPRILYNRLLTSSKNPYFQMKCTTFLVKMSFICTRMRNYFHMKGWALNLVFIQRPGGTQKWPVTLIRTYDVEKIDMKYLLQWFYWWLAYWSTGVKCDLSFSVFHVTPSLFDQVMARFCLPLLIKMWKGNLTNISVLRVRHLLVPLF